MTYCYSVYFAPPSDCSLYVKYFLCVVCDLFVCAIIFNFLQGAPFFYLLLFFLSIQSHLDCHFFPLSSILYIDHYHALLSQPNMQTEHKANQETFLKCQKCLYPCTTISGLQSICVWAKCHSNECVISAISTETSPN